MIENRLDEIGAIARQVAWGAADILQAYYRGNTDLEVKDKKGDPVTKADLAANHYILENLQKELAEEDFGYLSEENFNVEKAEPIAKDWVWIIDPLDGTRDFIEKTGEYAVHIALAYQGRPQLAVVVVPETDKLYFAIKGQGTKVETRSGEVKEIRASDRHKIEDLNLVASRSHRNLRLNKMLERIPFKERFAVGSVGCKVSTILEQKTDVYISLSGKSAPKDWDFAAPELILTEAGGNFTSFEGKDLLYNQGDVRQWGGLMASNGNCHQELYTMAAKILAEIDRELAEEV
ncbi:3'(2'),5'-bisphosphate nucleotidase CysQ family protein [Spirulina sp. 06S082]|uniref:3'(2'),5'-bisphosphate nucleotidase CysQ family protein n=1 Tax=Spirulina sp. 06S082 TaxID=3110248 RepID=UPI002B1F97E7|nr:inositol monophosphatase family protein [Spirulina sp. 06S082]MEA5470862.1 inositol monophosphatase family protein [Spirulina sp. 06S082]